MSQVSDPNKVSYHFSQQPRTTGTCSYDEPGDLF